MTILIMKKKIVLICLSILIAFFSCGREGKPKKHIENIGNTPYQTDSILVTYGTNPDRALILLDSAMIMGNIDEYTEQFLRSTIYSKSLEKQQLDSAMSICKALLQHDSVKNNPNNQEEVLNLLINTSRGKGDDNEYLHWSTQKAELCKEQGEEVELLRTEAEIGLIMTHLGRTDEGIKKIDYSIDQLDKTGSVDRMDAFIIASKRMIGVLNDLGRYAETIPLAQHILDRIDHYLKHIKDYSDDSYRLPWSDNPSDRDRYIDFYRAQANGFLAIAYAKTGMVQKAREHLTKFNHSNYGKSFSARRMIIPAQMALGLYDEAMNTCNEMVQRMGSDTINTIYATILHNLAIVARSTGHTEDAFDLMNRHVLLSKLLNDSLHKSKAHEYAARYHDKEQQLIIQKAESENQQKTIISVAIALLLAVAIIALLHFHKQHQRIAKKNRALVRMINESRLLTLEGNDAEEEDMENQPREEYVSHNEATEPNTQNDAKDFVTIDAIIRNERLYADSNLQRQDICDRFGITRITLNNMLFQYRGNASLPQYINSIRMEEAVKLLRNRPDLSITAIAENVGFSAANFRIQFIRSFGMTPMEFRQNL